MKRALVCGISGQDGAYLSKLLLSKGYEVIGSSRDVAGVNLGGIRKVGIESHVSIVSMMPTDFHSVLKTVVSLQPDEVYYLAGQTSVGLSFDQPVEAIESIVLGTLNLLEAIRFSGSATRLYSAGSGECFGGSEFAPASEVTPFNPRSPYAVAKACAFNLVNSYRDAYGLFACTGILFNHESPLRPERFVTQKVVQAAARIACGSNERLILGRLDVHRDWGWAEEYVEAMWRMLQQSQARDYVIATGLTRSLEYFVSTTFKHFNLDWRKYVEQDQRLFRPSDIQCGSANPSLAESALGWKANFDVDRVIKEMCNAAVDSMN